MLNIRFETHDDGYRRIITFPDGTTEEEVVSFSPKWHAPNIFPLAKEFHQYERPALIAEGKAIAATLLGDKAMQFLAAHADRDPLNIVIQENCQVPTVAKVPWELAFVDDRFLATDEYFPMMRRPSHLRPVNSLTVHSPLRMALISASPQDQNPLMVEEELLTIAFSLDAPMSAGELVVDEVMNCTRQMLRETLRTHRYDIVYFTGHGAFQDNTGFLCLENGDGTTDLMSADDFARDLRNQRGMGLLFLNCCNAASVGADRSASWEGFGDVARKAMKQAAPQVVATQAAIFDQSGKKLMKTFFEELCRNGDFDVAAALAIARGDLEDDRSEFHDFYHFVHLSLLEKGAVLQVEQTDAAETGHSGWQDNVVFHTPNRMDMGKGFVGRLPYISRIEELWWNEGVKVVGIHGLGGIGKTFLCGRMEQRALTHHLPARRLKKSIWIDFRAGVGDTVAGFLQQVEGIAFDFGYQAFRQVLDNHEQYPTPLEKFRPWFRMVNQACQGRALLILDNLESVLDAEGDFRDPELRAWFVELLVRTPGWKILVTCRHRFDFYPDGRNLVKDRWLHLTEMGITERLAIINRDSELRHRSESDKRTILKTAGGHPYIINLVARYLSAHPEIPAALQQAASDTAEYAQLDWFLSLLTPDELDWLLIIALFPPPRHEELILFTKLIRAGEDKAESVNEAFPSALRRLSELSLANADDSGIQIHPLVVWQLLENQESSYLQPVGTIDPVRQAISLVFLHITEDRRKPEQAGWLLQGVKTALQQPDRGLLCRYLQKCAAVFRGFVPASVFADIVSSAQPLLLTGGEQEVFYTLGFCAQTLCDMRHLRAATALFSTMLDDERLPAEERGKVLSALGTVYLAQRDWPNALESYHKALEWKEKTCQHHQLGSTWHQIGRVHEEQRDWTKALESYQQALEWNERTVQHHQLGNTWHQIGRVHEEQQDWPQALESYQNALEWNEKTVQHHELGGTWHQIGIVHQEQQDWAKSLESYQQALDWKEKTGQHHELGSTWHQIGRVHEEQRDWPKALESYQNALEWNEKTGQHHQLGGTWHQIGRVQEEQQDWLQALESYQQALEWKEKTGQHHKLGNTWHQIGRVHEKQRGFSTALPYYLQARELFVQTGQEENSAIAFGSLRRIFSSLTEAVRETLKTSLPEEIYDMLAKEPNASAPDA